MEDGNSRRRSGGLLEMMSRLVSGRRKVTEEDIRDLIVVGEEDGVVGEEEREMIRAIFDLDSTVVREIMVPRTAMAAISVDASIRETLDAIIACGHSRLPVFEGTLDNIIGLLYAKDLLKCWGMEPERISIRNLLRQPFFTPETKNLEELLQEFRKKRVHLAIVIDEYGGTSGLVTIEDLLEQIVGDIQDEYDVEQELYSVEPDGALTADARLPVEELEERFGMAIERDQFDTVGGLATHLAGGIPATGTVIAGAGLTIEVLDADPRRVKKVRIRRIPPLTDHHES
ncbi:Magnesium and cobalt efflux protein CorC [Trichlorobacter ammonificans]|uniref:Magnesium and cobalt efflux protein CorC n=1 Tax=Trichlorobacter ammonificans TaxID=2916410 RepID=A0ABM9DAY5_9BACT|nr:Magnesium and cobalt efflux protein CorC [Trichlorobacter ammonificans]